MKLQMQLAKQEYLRLRKFKFAKPDENYHPL